MSSGAVLLTHSSTEPGVDAQLQESNPGSARYLSVRLGPWCTGAWIRGGTPEKPSEPANLRVRGACFRSTLLLFSIVSDHRATRYSRVTDGRAVRGLIDGCWAPARPGCGQLRMNRCG
ncbi:unnamed protein product [Lota lota]